jgi:Flp pilus assembly protein CpaB
MLLQKAQLEAQPRSVTLTQKSILGATGFVFSSCDFVDVPLVQKNKDDARSQTKTTRTNDSA